MDWTLSGYDGSNERPPVQTLIGVQTLKHTPTSLIPALWAGMVVASSLCCGQSLAAAPAVDETITPAPIDEPEEVQENGGHDDQVIVTGQDSVDPSIATVSHVADPTVEQGSDSIRVVLPTRWPVTEASSYRIHDPTGIVIDVPGGVAGERVRWVETANERVRSVRVLERENGVRFIIYLNDENVPRYRVGYSRGGVTVDIMGPDPRHLSTK